MNFLAHLHIAEHSDSSSLGNLLGDFVKGRPQGQFPERIVRGIQLHRFVDSYTDHHPLIKEIKPLFTGESRRFAGIALDMFWDHCLATHWHQFSSQPLEAFCLRAQSKVLEEQHALTLPERFVDVTQHMWRGRWLQSYQELDNIEFALQRMSTRSPRMGKLSACTPILRQHYHTLNKTFLSLYPDVLSAAKQQAI
ncbi:ACP phosphodiesterase [Vibrio sp. AK197]